MEKKAIHFGDLQASAMAVDCLGKWTVLAGRRVLALVDLDNPPADKIYRLTRQSKYDISCIQWNPHASHAQLFATACMQKLDLYSWEDGASKQVNTMKAHARNISDIDWSPFDVNVIASCSVDTYTLLWDVRDYKRPTTSFQSVSGASQVKWNKVTNNLFATAHEGDVKIWDPRKNNQPVLFLTAHLSKIHGLDWSPFSETTFATSSHDCTAKFWDTNNSRQDKGMLKSGSPVWRARFTPFGDGLVTVVMSTLRRSENSLFLWNNSSLEQPVHQFIGHNDAVIEFQWRKKDEGEKDYQLVTWSKDQNLKIWKVDPGLQRLCGHDVLDSSENEAPLPEITESVPETQQKSPDNASINNNQSEHQPMTLYQEFSLVNKYIPNVTIDKLDETHRQCSVTITSGKYMVHVTVTFPVSYPNSAPPMFDITPTSTSTAIGPGMLKKLYRVLQETSQMNVKKNWNCLEPCIRQVATAFENMTMEERKTPDTDNFVPSTNLLQSPFMQLPPFAAFQDYSIPFPRTCGAQFNSAGLLVCFGRSREASKSSEKTPKALSELAAYSSTNRVRQSQSSTGFTMFSRSPPTPKAEPVSISSYYMPKRQRTKSRPLKDIQESKFRGSEKVKKEKKIFKLEAVRIYDIHCLLNIHRELGDKYRLDVDNLPAMCEHNKLEAATVGRKDLVRLWSLVPVLCNPRLQPSLSPDAGIPWAQRPFGRQMLESLFEYYKKIHDVQTLAMLCCVFWDRAFFTCVPSQSLAMKKSASKASLDYVPPNCETKFGSSTDSGWNLLPNKRRRDQTVFPISEDPDASEGLRESVKEEQNEEAVITDSSASLSTSHVTIISPLATTPSSLATPMSSLATGMSPTTKTTSLLSRAMVKIRRSNSLSDVSFEDYKFVEDVDPKEKADDLERKQHENNYRMLDPSKYIQYDLILKMYADILQRWGLLNQAAYVMKYVTIPPEPHTGIEFGVQCHYCLAEVRGVKCGTCKNQAFRCVICHKGVKGTSNFCLNCGHGGHSSHMREWFKEEIQCPTGCGCKCIKWNNI